jgi:hypothetical protein
LAALSTLRTHGLRTHPISLLFASPRRKHKYCYSNYNEHKDRKSKIIRARRSSDRNSKLNRIMYKDEPHSLRSEQKVLCGV